MKSPLSKVIVIALFIFLPIIGYYLGSKFTFNKCLVWLNKTTNCVPFIDSSNNHNASSWVKPIATDKAIPLVKQDHTLYWYSLTKKQLNSTKYKSGRINAAYGFGEEKPLLSPNGQYIAFINDEDGYLYILPSGSNEAIKITDYKVDYLNSWSSDSSKILFYSNLNNLVTSKEPPNTMEIPLWETDVSFNNKASPGFHYFNIENGQDIYLYPLTTADKFIDKNRILVEMNPFERNNKRYVLFNVDTFTADFSTVNYPIKSITTQKSFSADGTLWAKSVDDGFFNSDIKIIFSKFPDDQGDIVDTSAWSRVQWPLLNTDGTYLAYVSRQVSEDNSKDKTIIWDSTLKKNIKELNGFPEYWIDKNILLIGNGGFSTAKMFGYDAYSLYYADTETTETLVLSE